MSGPSGGRRPIWRNPRLLLRFAAVGLVVGGLLTAVFFCGFGVTAPGGDGWVYLAAGERLNAGHVLYALAPGDRFVLIVPPYWTQPLLSPPPIAVLWRPFALMGVFGMTVWGVITLVAMVGLMAAMLWTDVGRSLAVLAVVAAPLAITALSGNVNAILAPMLMAAWWLRRRPWAAGLLIGIALTIKVTPVFFVLWLLTARRWRQLAATITGAAITVGLSVLGAGIGPWIDWLRAAPGAAPSSLAVATLLGTTTTTVYVAAGVMIVLVAVVVRRESAVFAACAVAAALTTPALYQQALALLVVCGAPLVPVCEPGATAELPGLARAAFHRARARLSPAILPIGAGEPAVDLTS